ncbi:MAG: hypothetical protein NT093_03030 [Candidatus Moranbacteria bacterium]|nr:hypothetical protein [Candidatus Moranbacteria bacterium]
MNRNQKKSSKISGFFNKLFASRKPKSSSRISAGSVAGKRAVFFVLLAVLVLGFSFSFHAPHAFAWVPTQAERDAMKNGLWKATDAQIDQVLKDHPITKDQLTLESYLPQKIQADRDAANMDATGMQTSNPDVGLSAAGKGLLDIAAVAVLNVVIGVLSVIVSFLMFLVEYAAKVLDLMLNPALYNFTNRDIVVQGWTIVRDVCNLLFLLVLLFIAICTILKIEKYHAKKTLLMLIIMALLINFSKPITVFIFDGSQLLMNFFLSQMGKAGTGQSSSTVVMEATQISNIIFDSLPKGLAGSSSQATMIAVQYLFAVVFIFMLGVAFLVTALMLVIRIVAIMLLIIVSPFAFFAAIVPDFSKMSSQWWSSLFEYSYYGPAAAFFLLLATKLGTSLPNVTSQANGQTIEILIQNIVHYLVVLVFLYASIFMAKKFGGGAGAAIVGNADKFMKRIGKGTAMAPYRATAWGAKATGVPGAVSQRLQQSRLGRLFTKEGREEALEEREAAVAEKIGVKGAKARQTRKRAEKYKKEGYSKEALQKMVARGDTAAGLRLAEDGDLNDADYAKLAVNFKGKEDPIKKLIDGKLKEKRLDVLINYRINKEAKGKDGSINADTANDIAREEIGKLNPSKWKDQDMQKMLGFNEKGEETQLDSAALARRGMVKEIYNKLDEKGRAKTTDDMSGSKYAAFKAVVIPPPTAAPQPATPPPNIPWS